VPRGRGCWLMGVVGGKWGRGGGGTFCKKKKKNHCQKCHVKKSQLQLSSCKPTLTKYHDLLRLAITPLLSSGWCRSWEQSSSFGACSTIIGCSPLPASERAAGESCCSAFSTPRQQKAQGGRCALPYLIKAEPTPCSKNLYAALLLVASCALASICAEKTGECRGKGEVVVLGEEGVGFFMLVWG
jgi:hypothetical protein